MGAQWLRFALATEVEWDSCTVRDIVSRAGGDSLDLREVLGELVLSETFRMRSPN